MTADFTQTNRDGNVRADIGLVPKRNGATQNYVRTVTIRSHNFSGTKCQLEMGRYAIGGRFGQGGEGGGAG